MGYLKAAQNIQTVILAARSTLFIKASQNHPLATAASDKCKKIRARWLSGQLSHVRDPRVLNRSRHLLIDILVLGILAIICHAETWTGMEDFGHGKEQWLRKFMDLPGGVPSHDTISRVFSIVNPRELGGAFIAWVNTIRKKHDVQDVICLDGKVVRGTIEHKEGQGRTRLNLVSGWATANGLVPGQIKTETGGSETSAALELIDLLDIENMITVGDASIGSSSVVNQVVSNKADYIFPAKANSRGFFPRVKSHSEKKKWNARGLLYVDSVAGVGDSARQNDSQPFHYSVDTRFYFLRLKA